MTIHKYLTELIECNKKINNPCIKICIDHDKMIYIRDKDDHIHYTHMNKTFMFSEYISIDMVEHIIEELCMKIKISVLLKFHELDVYGNEILSILENIKLYYPDRHIKISSKIDYN